MKHQKTESVQKTDFAIKKTEQKATERKIHCPVCSYPISMNDEQCLKCKTIFDDTSKIKHKTIKDKFKDFLSGSAKQDETIDLKRKKNKDAPLVNYNDLNNHLKLKKQNFKGIDSIAIDDIIGSIGRYNDFNQHFLPLDGFTTKKLDPIVEIMQTGKELPPISVYKVSEKYFVIDGHHRVRAAMLLKRSYIDAEITEIEFDTPLDNEQTIPITSESLKTFIIELERKEFQKKTYLYNNILANPIIVTNISSYAKLYDDIISQYKRTNKNDYDTNIIACSFEWYRMKYLPVINLINSWNLLEKFPKRTEADLYVWLLMHQVVLAQKTENEIGFKTTISDFIRTNGRKKFFDNIPTRFDAYLKYIMNGQK